MGSKYESAALIRKENMEAINALSLIGGGGLCSYCRQDRDGIHTIHLPRVYIPLHGDPFEEFRLTKPATEALCQAFNEASQKIISQAIYILKQQMRIAADQAKAEMAEIAKELTEQEPTNAD